MGSMYAKLRQEKTLGSSLEKSMRLTDFDDTDPYYFVVKENDKTIAEGDLMSIKLKLPEEYTFKKIKSVIRNRTNMVAEVIY